MKRLRWWQRRTAKFSTCVQFHWCVVLTIMPGMQLVCWALVLAPACTVWPICQEAGGDIIIFIEIEGGQARPVILQSSDLCKLLIPRTLLQAVMRISPLSSQLPYHRDQCAVQGVTSLHCTAVSSQEKISHQAPKKRLQ